MYFGLKEAGQKSFSEDVSPLSVVVARTSPNDACLKVLLNFQPDAVNKPDKDGAFALMYASAWNETELCVHYMHQLNPQAIKMVDKYGYHGERFHIINYCAHFIQFRH